MAGGTVTIVPADVSLECDAGETLIQCAWRSGFYWPTICGGTADCGACRCEILSGARHVAPMGAAEAGFFERNPKTLEAGRLVRLACCMTVNGPVTVAKAGVRPK